MEAHWEAPDSAIAASVSDDRPGTWNENRTHFTPDTPAARAHRQREEDDELHEVFASALQKLEMPWPVYDCFMDAIAAVRERDPGTFRKWGAAMREWYHKAAERRRRLAEIERKHETLAKKNLPERIRIEERIDAIGKELKARASMMSWPGDPEVTSAELIRFPEYVHLGRGYQMQRITTNKTAIELGPKDWSPLSRADMAALETVFELCKAQNPGPEDAYEAFVMVVGAHLSYPTQRPDLPFMEDLVRRAKTFLSVIGPRQPGADKSAWTKALVYLRWQSMVGLPYGFEIGGAEVPGPPPGFERAIAEGRPPNDPCYFDTLFREALHEERERLYEELKRVDRYVP